MAFPVETLHDFALALLNDEAAMAAYTADPVGALREAGFSDLTPADMQEVLTLVRDDMPVAAPAEVPPGASASAEAEAEANVEADGSGAPMDGECVGDAPADTPGGAPGLGDLPVLGGLPGLGDLPAGLPGLPGLGDLPVDLPSGLPGLPDAGALPALGDLPVDVPAGLPGLGDLPVDVPAGLPGLGDLPVDVPAGLPGLGDLPAGLPTGLPALSDLPNLGDLDTPAGGVDASVDTGTTGFATSVTNDVLHSATSGFHSNPDDGDAPTISHTTHSMLGDLTADGKLAPEEFGGSLGASSELVDLDAGLVGHASGDVAAGAAVDTVAGGLAGGLTASPDGVTIAGQSPLGSFSASSDGEFSIDPANPADLLDVDHLGTTGDAVAGTVAHVASSGTHAVTGGLENGADQLAGLLTGPAAPAADVVGTATDAVTDGVEQGGATVADHLSSLPAVDDLPLPQLPALPALPDVPTIDSGAVPAVGDVTGTVSDTVADVTSSLPVDTTSLPVDTSTVTGLVSHNPVTDAVHDSPVGGLVSGVTDHLPQDAPIVGDLDLGL